MKKSSNISATALHHFIPQSASGRSSELSLLSFCLCLAAFLVLLNFWRLLRLHGLFFRTIVCELCRCACAVRCGNDIAVVVVCHIHIRANFIGNRGQSALSVVGIVNAVAHRIGSGGRVALAVISYRHCSDTHCVYGRELSLGVVFVSDGMSLKHI